MGRMEQLVEILNKHAYNYYVLDNPTISDSEYDKLYDELRMLENSEERILPSSPTQRVGGEPLKAFASHKHINRLYSLDKAQTKESLIAFINKFPKGTEFTVEPKFDGLTICLTYENGKFSRATTRGDGSVGEDVTSQVLTIQTYPLEINYKGKLEVYGEGLIFLSALEKYNKTATEPLKNARNAVAGAIRNLDPNETKKRSPKIIFYGVNYADDENLVNSQTEVVEFLKLNGFLTSPIFECVASADEVIRIVDEIEEQRSALDFLIDGVVVKLNDRTKYGEIGYTEKFPKFAIAYKFEAEEATTKLVNVIWQVGRTGKLTPLAILQPVDLCGATISRATLNNFGDIARKRVKIGDRVFVRRSNDVIPEILSSAETFADSKEIQKPEHCPECGAELIENGANLFCPNEFSCTPQVVGRIVHFASKAAMDIEGLSEMTTLQLYRNLGVCHPYQLYELTREQLMSLDGFKDKKSENILSAISKSKTVSLSKFIYALGILNVGVKTAKDLAEKYKTFADLENAQFEELKSIDDVGEVIAQSIVDYFSQEKEELKRLLAVVSIDSGESKKSGGVFDGQKFVLTGTLDNYKRSEAQKLIEENGGEIMSSVSAATNVLLCGSEAGSKLDKAQKLGVKIMYEQEFIKIIQG